VDPPVEPQRLKPVREPIIAVAAPTTARRIAGRPSIGDLERISGRDVCNPQASPGDSRPADSAELAVAFGLERSRRPENLGAFLVFSAQTSDDGYSTVRHAQAAGRRCAHGRGPREFVSNAGAWGWPTCPQFVRTDAGAFRAISAHVRRRGACRLSKRRKCDGVVARHKRTTFAHPHVTLAVARS
jgi:hypothetical protein